MAQATATDEKANEVRIDEAGPARKQLTITVGADAVSEKIEESFGVLAGQAVLPGFRKGRAPRALIERRFGENVRTETRNQLIADAYAKAIEEHGIRPLGEPEPAESMDDLVIEPGRPLTFSVYIEVVPDFELPATEGLEIAKPVIEVSDADVAEELERQQLRFGTPEEIEGSYKAGDRIVCRATVWKEDEDKPFFRNDQVLVIYPGKEDQGRGQILGLLVDGLADALKDRQPGASFTIETTGPESHEREDIRGRKIRIEGEVIRALRIEPAGLAEVMQQYGMESEEILREQIRLAMEQRRDQEVASAMREQVVEKLLEQVEFELPEKLSAAQAARTIERQRYELLYRGVTPDEVERRLAETRAQSETATRDRLKLTFVMHRLADELKVEVSEQEVNGYIAAIATQRGMRPEQLRSELVQSGQLNQVAGQLREQKTADRIVATAKVTELPVEEYRKLRGGGASKKTSTKKTPAKKSGSKKTTTKKKKTSKKKKKTSG